MIYFGIIFLALPRYLEIFINGYVGYAGYLYHEITHPSLTNYFYWLIAVSLFFFLLEVIIPWRKNQPVLRRDFWLDFFYMFFNFFLFSLVIYNAASDVVVNLFNDSIKLVSGGFDLQSLNPLRSAPFLVVLLVGFIVRDFVQWMIHRLLHRVEWLWNFHKVHHSVQEMGFAAHLRYHWMENVVYRSLEYIPLALLGIGLYDFFIIHIFTLAWGHYNHSNISVSGRVTGVLLSLFIGFVLFIQFLASILFTLSGLIILGIVILLLILFGAYVLGPFMKKIFNSPEMHIWHHAETLPDGHQYGINFGLTLAIWDYLFGTAAIPHDGRDIKLGFPDVDSFPDDFVSQNKWHSPF